MVSVECLNKRTFICQVNNNIPLGWNIAGLSGISIPGPFLARNASLNNPRIMSNDTGADTQTRVSVITISGFSISDNGGIIQCVHMNKNNSKGMATISIGECVVMCYAIASKRGTGVGQSAADKYNILDVCFVVKLTFNLINC